MSCAAPSTGSSRICGRLSRRTERVQYKKLHRAVDERSGVELVAPNNRLTPLRLDKLNAIGFAWTAKPVRPAGSDAAARSAAAAAAATCDGESPPPMPNVHEKTRESTASHRQSAEGWEEMYQRLVQFRQREGHCVVPRRYEADPKLAAWVEQQRTLWNRQRKTVSVQMSGASDSSSDRLDELGGASDDPASAYADAAGLAVLDARETDEKLTASDLDRDMKPPTSLSVEKTLSLERKMRLDALGFVWSLRSKRVDDHWDGMFQQVCTFSVCMIDRSRIKLTFSLFL